MVFRRDGAATYAFQARLRDGRHKQLQTAVPLTKEGKALARRIEEMWNSLALEHRAWDLLQPVLESARGERARRLGRLYDVWVQTKYNPTAMRRLLSDVDLEPFVAEFAVWYEQHVLPDTVAHAVVHVRALIPEGATCPVSRVTTEWLEQALASYRGTRNTKRRVHSHWTRFFGYCQRVHKLFDRSPMDDVERPPEQRRPIRFYELETVERVVDAQPTPERRALFALLYGTGIEVGTALRLTRADVMEGRQEIRAAGTKAHARDRIATVSDWAWRIVRQHVRPLLPTAPLFPGMRVDVVWHWHRKTVEDLKLPELLKVHAARHHWAVLSLRNGVPIAVVQRQLGHSTAKLTLDTYGAFIPQAEDRARWREHVTKAEKKRRDAMRGTTTGAV